MTTAKEIQTEMVLAQDIALEEARAIVGGANNSDKAERLKALGFANALGADPVRDREQAEALVAFTRRYAEQYPGLKFISEDVMDEVCDRYGLLVGQPGNYTGAIPEWALAQIEANAHHIDVRKEEVFTFNSRFMNLWLRMPTFEFDEKTGAMTTKWEDQKPEPVAEEPKEYRTITNLRIAAPKHEMELADDEETDGRNIVKVKDPIVCIEVAGGYVVLAAWGEEGRDPQVFNALNN